MREINPNETDKLYECLEALAEHHNQVSVYFKGHYPQTPSEQKIRQFESELEEGRARIAVAENDGKVIGFCKIITDASSDTAAAAAGHHLRAGWTLHCHLFAGKCMDFRILFQK